MKKQRKRRLYGFHANQGGQAIILVLILLVIGSLVLVPSLSLTLTALHSDLKYQSRTSEVYTADAGIEDAVWRIKYDYFGPNYDPSDYGTTYNYQTDEINGLKANVSIENLWMPTVSLASLNLTTAEAQSIIEDGRLIVTGTAGAIAGAPYHIKIDYDPVDPSENLTVTSIGIWLPQGFTYTPGSGTLENLNFSDPGYAEPVVSPAEGGTTVVWNYSYPYPLFTDFPGVSASDSPMNLDLSFDYTPPSDNPDEMPTGIAWITTQLQDGSPSPYPISWDVDNQIYKITSTVGNTSIEAYSSKTETRQIGDAMTGDYVAIGNSLMIDTDSQGIRHTLLTDSTTAITTVPSDGDALDAYLYWTGWRSGSHIVTVLSDSGSDITTNWQRGSPSDWSQGSGDYVGQDAGGGTAADYLTLDTQDLSSYTPGSVLITWDQSSSDGAALYDDTADNLDGWTEGSAWSQSHGEFVGTDNPGGAAANLTMSSPVDLSAATPGSLTVSWDQSESGSLSSSDSLYYAFSADNGTTWSDPQLAFSDDNPSSPMTVTIPSTYLTSQFKLRFSLEGFNQHNKDCYLDNIKIAWAFTSADGLDFAVSGDNGATWSDPVEAFRGGVTSSDNSYEYYLPAEYTTGQFLFRFDTVGLYHGQAVSVDNFLIRDLPPDPDVTFEINGQQVYYDASGNPQAGTEPLVADSSAVLLAPQTYALGGYFYRCKTDVSKLVKTYPVDPGEEHHTGNASYTVGDVSADTGNYLSYAGWSMILVYTSPTSAGHYLYLRDYFAENPGYTDLDFDQDGQPGGDVTNFIIPEPIRNQSGNITETDAARITCFVGEGDSGAYGSIYTGDSLIITGQQSGKSLYLSNSASPWNDVWNGLSPGMSYPGIDVDTFDVPWSSGILTPGDTSLHLDMPSGGDAWTFIYLILSVRSKVQTGGTTYYLINRN